MSKLFTKFLKYLPFLSFTAVKKPYFNDDSFFIQEIQNTIQRLYLSPLDFQLAQFKVFELDSGQIGKQVAAHLDIDLGKLSSKRFNDGQCNLQVLDSVRGHSVYLIKSFSERKINDGIIQLLIAVNTLKKVGAQKVTCIIPFLPYCQSNDLLPQDQTTFFTCFGSDILKLLENSGCDRIITFNSMMPNPQGYLNKCNLININAPDLFVSHLMTKELKNPVLVGAYINTTNTNNLNILRNALKSLNLDCSVSTFNDGEYIGDKIDGQDVILYSNIMRTGKTFIQESKKLKQLGARNIYGCAFHCLSTSKQMQKLQTESYLKQLIITNSLPHKNYPNNIKFKSLSRIIAETISLFEQQKTLNEYRKYLQDRKIQAINSIRNMNMNSIE